MTSADITRIETKPDAALQTTLPPAATLAKTRGDLAGSRRPSLLATLGGAAAPLPERYEEGRVLGKGGMGVVVLATDRDLARSVAVKKLQPDATGPEHLDRFLQEAQVTAQLEHPGILPVHDLGVDEKGNVFYVMRLVRGDETLRRVIDRLKAGDAATHREFTFERRVRIVQRLAEILHYAHVKGVVHRDVKPENIMLGSFGEVYLVDWGLAKVAGTSTTEPAGSIVGTPLYMAPEQARGEPATPLSDVYSLGAILSELLSLHHYLGTLPDTVEAILEKVVSSQPIPAESYFEPTNGRVPRFLSFICERALEKDPAKRFPSAEALERALEGYVEGEGPIRCPVTFQLRAMTVYRRALHRHPIFFGFLTTILPLLALIAYAAYRIVR